MFRIPLPELKDSDKLDKIMYMKEATKRIRLGPDNLPSICFYSFLNAYQVIGHPLHLDAVLFPATVVA